MISMLDSFNGKIALITGSSAGIGKATALLFSSLGAKVAIVGRDQSKLDKVAAECEAKSPHHYKPVVIKADFIRDEDVIRTFQETISAYKTLDILVNNAGLHGFPDFDDPNYLVEYDRNMQVNVRSIIRLTELSIPFLNKSAGNIVNVSAINSLTANPSHWVYGVSKAALDMFTRSMAGKLAPNIRVNSVNPGAVHTHPLEPSMLEKFISMKPLKRIAGPIEIANLIAFLASDASRNMTGSIVVSDSGYLCADPYKVLSGI
ncbi:uncharacterized protein LOC107360981 [Tetranychus urticae]|uniref:uncharacterized protein LOC107360981 n=1 Tax=Tetranychus urticae TaxID=32264 RepID=UPI00077B9527|nr:uncharacterized protein LOC107360981 [Tetranychus urticae]